MAFREKLAWMMSGIMALTGVYYIWLVSAIPSDAPPLGQLGALAPYVLVLVVVSVVANIALALLSPKEANQPADERERAVIDRAGHWSGYVLAVIVVVGGGLYLGHGNGNTLFVWMAGGLIVAQLAEYLFQIALFRRGA